LNASRECAPPACSDRPHDAPPTAPFKFGEIAGSIRRIGTNFVAVWIVHLAVLALTFVTFWMILMIVVHDRRRSYDLRSCLRTSSTHRHPVTGEVWDI
jgi:hypothetical protein